MTTHLRSGERPFGVFPSLAFATIVDVFESGIAHLDSDLGPVEARLRKSDILEKGIHDGILRISGDAVGVQARSPLEVIVLCGIPKLPEGAVMQSMNVTCKPPSSGSISQPGPSAGQLIHRFQTSVAFSSDSPTWRRVSREMTAEGMVANACSAAGESREMARGMSWYSSSLEEFSRRLWSRRDPHVLPGRSKPCRSKSTKSRGARIEFSDILEALEWTIEHRV